MKVKIKYKRLTLGLTKETSVAGNNEDDGICKFVTVVALWVCMIKVCTLSK